MSSPLLEDIISAVKDPIFIKDPFLKDSSVNILKNGRPIMYGGGFSQVFPVTKKDSSKWAFKIWHTEIPNNEDRYSKIRSHLSKCNLPYFCDFTFVKNGILVNGQLLDTFRMEWIEGTSLLPYITSIHKNPNELRKLGDNFLIMIKRLHESSISHGDLQHENIFIKSNGEIVLIDYDSVCVPDLDGKNDFCRGRAGYQHPSRFSTGLIASIKMDFFSELIIYLSIRALMENSLLWDSHNCEQAERLLFNHWDFLDFENSAIRRDLMNLSSEVKSLVAILENYLASHINLSPFA